MRSRGLSTEPCMARLRVQAGELGLAEVHKGLMIASLGAVLTGAYSPPPLYSGDDMKNPGVSGPAPIQ